MASNYMYCTVPETKFPLGVLLKVLVEGSKRFRAGATALRRGSRIVEEFSKLKAGSVWKLAREDWADVRDELREPNGGEFPAIHLQGPEGPQTLRLTWEWLPLCDMIEDASETEPAAEESPEPEPEPEAEPVQEEPKAAE